MTKNCIQCDSLLPALEKPIPGGIERKYCSIKCRRKFNYLKTRDKRIQKIKQDRIANPEKRKLYRDKNKQKINATARNGLRKTMKQNLSQRKS